MNKKMAIIGSIAAVSMVGAGVGLMVKSVKPKKKPLGKTAGKALKSVGTMMEHLSF